MLYLLQHPWLRGLAFILLGGILTVSVERALKPKPADPTPVTIVEAPISPQTQTDPWRSESPVEPVLAETLIQNAAVQYYPVDGDTWDQLAASVETLGHKMQGADAKTTYHLMWHAGNTNDGVCGLSKGTVTAETTVIMPRWSIMPNSMDEARQWWSYFIHKLAEQQQHHVDMAMEQAKSATMEMRNASCETGDSVWAAINTRLEGDQRDYDTVHGNQETDLRFEPRYEPILSSNGQNPLAAIQANAALSTNQASPKAVNPGKGFSKPLPRDQNPADFSLELETLDGVPVPLSFKKGRVIFLNFWATWCGPCRKEEPKLEKLYQAFKDKDIFFAFVTTERPGQVQSFVNRMHWTIPIYCISPQAAAPLVSEGLPTTLVISKNGDIVLQEVGTRSWDNPQFAAYLESLINE